VSAPLDDRLRRERDMLEMPVRDTRDGETTCDYCGHTCPERDTLPLDDGVMCKWCLAGEVPIRIYTTRESYEKAIYDGQ